MQKQKPVQEIRLFQANEDRAKRHDFWLLSTVFASFRREGEKSNQSRYQKVCPSARSQINQGSVKFQSLTSGGNLFRVMLKNSDSRLLEKRGFLKHKKCTNLTLPDSMNTGLILYDTFLYCSFSFSLPLFLREREIKRDRTWHCHYTENNGMK